VKPIGLSEAKCIAGLGRGGGIILEIIPLVLML
jgi:hypothetical protein